MDLSALWPRQLEGSGSIARHPGFHLNELTGMCLPQVFDRKRCERSLEPRRLPRHRRELPGIVDVVDVASLVHVAKAVLVARSNDPLPLPRCSTLALLPHHSCRHGLVNNGRREVYTDRCWAVRSRMDDRDPCSGGDRSVAQSLDRVSEVVAGVSHSGEPRGDFDLVIGSKGLVVLESAGPCDTTDDPITKDERLEPKDRPPDAFEHPRDPARANRRRRIGLDAADGVLDLN